MTVDGSSIRPFRRFALALLAMSGTGLVASTAVADVPYVMDDAFRTSADAIAQALAAGNTGGALQGAKALAASADQPFEKYAAGQLMLQAASATSDLQAQRGAVNLILASGAAAPARVGELRALAGELSAMLGNYGDAVAQVQYANSLGYSSALSQLALADGAFHTGNVPVGSAALEEAIKLRTQAGQPVDAGWYDRAIAMSYQAKRSDLLDLWTRRKIAAYPGPENWRSGIVNLIAGAVMGPEQSLDLYRLMAVTQALATERDWQAYSALAAQQGAFAEAKAVLDTAVKSGAVNGSDVAVKKSLAALTPKARQALADIKAPSAKAKAASDGRLTLALADSQFAAANYPDAVQSYRTALQKGVVDPARANTRLGIALARSGDLAGGKAALAQVASGPWAPVAGLWTVWIDRKMAPSPAV